MGATGSRSSETALSVAKRKRLPCKVGAWSSDAEILSIRDGVLVAGDGSHDALVEVRGRLYLAHELNQLIDLADRALSLRVDISALDVHSVDDILVCRWREVEVQGHVHIVSARGQEEAVLSLTGIRDLAERDRQ